MLDNLPLLLVLVTRILYAHITFILDSPNEIEDFVVSTVLILLPPVDCHSQRACCTRTTRNENNSVEVGR